MTTLVSPQDSGGSKLAHHKFCLSNGVSIGYTAGMTKDSGLRIRVERELRDQFLEACRQQDRPAAQVLREFMRQHVAENQLPKVKSIPKTGTKRRDESAFF
jgi:hypothetical protein